MKVIWKYELDLTGTQELNLPEGAEILTAQMQWDDCCCWVLQEQNATTFKSRKIRVYGTGHPVAEGSLDYISTVQLRGMVLHIFEELL